MSAQATAEQQQAVQKFVQDFQSALAPARLANTHENGVVLEAERQRLRLPMTIEGMVKVVNSVLFENKLTWVVEPEKLKSRKVNTAIQNKNDAAKSQDAFAAKKRVGETADSQKAADEVSIKQAKSLIAGYTPTKTTPRGQVIDYADQTRAQEQWTKAMNQAVTGKQNLQSWVTALAEAIQQRYAAIERASERL
jgi:hypothetical protein